VSRMRVDLRQRVLDVAIDMINERGSAKLRVADVAERANTGIPTIYYHFESRAQLIAEAQVAIYLKMVEPMHQSLESAESALAAHDEGAFVTAIERNVVMAWTSGQVDRKLGIMRLFQDVWSHPRAQRYFSEMLEIQFDRWIEVIERAKALGWIDPIVSARTFLSFFWSASVGQIITANAAHMDLTPAEIGDFVRRVVRLSSLEASPTSD
jgi:AcrR family transcriptional regulator